MSPEGHFKLFEPNISINYTTPNKSGQLPLPSGVLSYSSVFTVTEALDGGLTNLDGGLTCIANLDSSLTSLSNLNTGL